MIPVILMTVLGATSFVSHEFPGLNVLTHWSTAYVVHERVRDYRNIDIDGDGYKDLVLPDGVLFQRDYMFPEEGKLPFSINDKYPQCDHWGNKLYLRYENKLEVIQFNEGSWSILQDQKIAWPDSKKLRSFVLDNLEKDKQPQVSFERFLHDFNSDNKPEIVVLSKQGVHIFESD